LKFGIYALNFFKDEVLICKFPTKISLDERGRLHSTTGKAIEWCDGEGYYFINGVFFNKRLWGRITSKEITPKEAIALKNIEQRTIALQQIGWDILLKNLGGSIIENRKIAGSEEPEQLIEMDLKDETDNANKAKFIRVYDPSIKAMRLLRVPPAIKGIEEGRAWSFSKTPDEFKPMLQLPKGLRREDRGLP
jgi:hypothetical protein